MSKVTLHPSDKDAVVAVHAVKNSQSDRKYKHYVKAYGKSVNGRVSFAYLEITKDPNKAEEEGFLLPSEWIDIQSKAFSNSLKRSKEKLGEAS